MNQTVYWNIYTHGTYYKPAYKHYPRADNSRTKVSCDRCQRSNLNSCIGWNTYDLCLECVSKVEKLGDITSTVRTERTTHTTRMMQKQFRKPQDLTLMMQEQFQEDPSRYFGGRSPWALTSMEQDMFKSSGTVQIRTNMEQGMYKPNKYPQCTTDMEQGIFRSNTYDK